MAKPEEAPPDFAVGFVLGAFVFVFGSGFALMVLNANLLLGSAVLAVAVAAPSVLVFTRAGAGLRRGFFWGALSGSVVLAVLLLQLLSRIE